MKKIIISIFALICLNSNCNQTTPTTTDEYPIPKNAITVNSINDVTKNTDIVNIAFNNVKANYTDFNNVDAYITGNNNTLNIINTTTQQTIINTLYIKSSNNNITFSAGTKVTTIILTKESSNNNIAIDKNIKYTLTDKGSNNSKATF